MVVVSGGTVSAIVVLARRLRSAVGGEQEEGRVLYRGHDRSVEFELEGDGERQSPESSSVIVEMGFIPMGNINYYFVSKSNSLSLN